MNPEIMVLDEPTAGLDPKGASNILKLLYIIYLYKNYAVYHFVIYSIYLNDIHVTLGEIYLK